tara:strand:+ start:188 stop:523 length:336 start_codon:yes stop_codon:yes gene_type:complete
MSKFSSPFMAKSPLKDDDEKRVKISKGGDNKYNDRSTEYIRGNREGERGRSVEISQGNIDPNKSGEDNEYATKTVRKVDKDGNLTKNKSKKISTKRAERIKKRKDKSHKEI